jgi:hypothetical protein
MWAWITVVPPRPSPSPEKKVCVVRNEALMASPKEQSADTGPTVAEVWYNFLVLIKIMIYFKKT